MYYKGTLSKRRKIMKSRKKKKSVTVKISGDHELLEQISENLTKTYSLITSSAMRARLDGFTSGWCLAWISNYSI